jgi:spectinomycin phosphotransferase
VLEKPDISDERIRICLRDHYGLHANEIAFLPIGNDVHTAVYRAIADDQTAYFLKLRSGAFDPTTVAIPDLLHRRGIAQIIPPIRIGEGELWARMDGYAVTLFPFVTGRNGFAAPLTERQWRELGAAVRALHETVVPPSLGTGIPREQYAPLWRDRVRAVQELVATTAFTEPVAAQMAAYLHAKRAEIAHIVARAEALGAQLRAEAPPRVLCHADLHAANVLIDVGGALFIIDWDTLLFAPKERDLMFIGGGVGGAWNSAQEAAWFYRGYGQSTINPVALAYYRFERIVEDIAEYSERLLLSNARGADRAAGFAKFPNQFLPGNVVEAAYRADIA